MDEFKQRKIAKMVGTAVARYRIEAGLTQEEVAEKMGIGNEAVSRMERGAVLPTVARLFEFAEIFDCRVNDLMLGASDRVPDQASDIALLIQDLPREDRELLMGMVKVFCSGLKLKTTDRKTRQ